MSADTYYVRTVTHYDLSICQLRQSILEPLKINRAISIYHHFKDKSDRSPNGVSQGIVFIILLLMR